jgi:hypothetical protein
MKVYNYHKFSGRTIALLAAALLACHGQAQTNDLPTLATVHRSPVVIVHDARATDSFEPRADRVQAMVDQAIIRLTGRRSTAEAWRSLVSNQDIIGVKVFSEPGPHSGTRPAVAAAVVRGLLAAGIPRDHVILWDRHKTDLRLAGFVTLGTQLGVRVAGSAEAGYDENAFYDSPLLGNLVWGDFEFGKKGEGVGRKSFVSRLVTAQMTKIINITPLMNHNEAGVTGCLFSLAAGSVDNFARFESDAERLSKAVPEIYALTNLSDHVVLNIVDGLICQYEGEERSLLHYSTPLNELRFSRDPVALDVLSVHELNRQRQLAHAPAVKPNLDLYANAQLLELGVSDLRHIEVEPAN